MRSVATPDDAFVANNLVDSWSLAGITGGVAASDLVPVAAMTEFALPLPSSYPNGIAAGPDGNVWFTEYGTNKVGRITPAGVITRIPDGFGQAIRHSGRSGRQPVVRRKRLEQNCEDHAGGSHYRVSGTDAQ